MCIRDSLRNGEQKELVVTLRTAPKLVPRLDGVDAQPKYLVVGGLVFVPLSVPFLEHHFGCATVFSQCVSKAVVHDHLNDLLR